MAPSAPLQPLSTPGFALTVSPHTLLTGVFYILVLYWVIYTLVAVYHWVTYSHNATIATPAIVLHVFVSLVLIGYAVSGLV